MLFKNGINQQIRSFVKDTSGQFTMLAGLAMTVIVLGTGGTIELTNQLNNKTRLQSISDGASLVVMKSTERNPGQVTRLVQDYVALHYQDNPSRVSIVEASKTDSGAVVHLRHEFPTLFGRALGLSAMNVEARSAVNQEVFNLDLALVLDNTGSMRGRKLAALKQASNDLVDILYENPASRPGTQIGLVPFASWVNIGRDNIDASWVDFRGRSRQNDIYFDQNVSRPNLISAMDKNWDGCVENRLPPYDVDDTAPDISNPETMFQLAFQPDMSDVDSNSFSYVADTNGGNNLARLRGASKYNVTLPRNNPGPTHRVDGSCNESRALTPLTNNEGAIRRGIRNMVAQGWTNIANGASWGFRVLSPNAPFTEGLPYGQEKTTKAMVILTDGAQTMGGQSGTIFNSGYGPFGYLGEPTVTRDPRLEGANVKEALDNKLEEVCEAAKAKDIVVYTITFELNDRGTQNLMRNCATDPGKYFDAQNASQLAPVFREIAANLTDLRISQ